jgi:hypothetical protein
MPPKYLFAAAGVAALAAAMMDDALACACCTSPGQRNVAVQALDASRRAEINRLRFAGSAQLYTGEADPGSIKGIATPSQRYELNVVSQKDQLAFAFRDQSGRSGSLSLQLPSTISIFEVDPRTPKMGGEPLLYKEWKLTSKAGGSGVFSVGLGPNQLLTLIVHGRGNSCTSSDDFTDWTLVMQGAKANYSLFGELVSTP